MGVLEDILETKRAEVALLEPKRGALEAAAALAPEARDLRGALRRADGGLAVVAELKRRSPSKGDLAPDLDPARTAKAYEAGGAAALSVLTDGRWFGGDLEDLVAARAATSLPVLRKDFTVDALQIFEARAAGADAVLLIVAALPDDALLADLHALAVELGLAVLVEVKEAVELERALRAGARIVGVNSRDLRDFTENLGVAEGLATAIPDDVIRVAESAIRSVADARRVADVGYDAVLVGEHLVRHHDPTTAVAELAAVRVQRDHQGG